MTDKELNAEILRLSTKLIEAESSLEEVNYALEQHAEFIEQGGSNLMNVRVESEWDTENKIVAVCLTHHLRTNGLQILKDSAARATAFADGVRRELALAMQEYSKRNLFPGSEGANAAFKDFMKATEK